MSEPLQNNLRSICDAFHKIIGCVFFSKFDLEQGYYQIKIKQEDCSKTGFVTPFGIYEWTMIPLRLLNPPKFFHNVIARSVQETRGISVFIDDIIIYSGTLYEHKETINQVIEKLKENNIIINPKKSTICESSIEYLGFIVSKQGYALSQSRMEDFTCWDTLKTRKQCQILLGKINWYKQFIPNLSSQLQPFYDKLKAKKRNISMNDQ